MMGRNMRRVMASALVIIVLLAGIVSAVSWAGNTAQDGRARTEMVAMPDGVKLATSIYLPAGDGPWPVLLIRTPYGRSEVEDFSSGLVRFGVAMVAQDVRGQYDSEGEPSAFFSDRVDGQATLEWIAAQEWSNGRIATFGGSALGIAQYLMAPSAPESLRCQWVEVATPDLFIDAAFQGGVWRTELTERWLEENNSAHLIEPFKSHSLNDSYWDPVQITGQYGDIHVPAVHISGWYDIFSRGAVAAFLGYQNEGGDGAAGNQHLIMGPWTHAVNSMVVGELVIPHAMLREYEDWIEYWVRSCLLDDTGGPPDLSRMAAVTYFTMGAVGEEGAPGNEWHTADTWPPSNVEVPLYLLPNNYLSVDAPTDASGGDTFIYDPTNPTPTIGGANLNIDAGAFDQRPVERREDVVIYSTPPLEDPVEVTGDVRAEIWITTDVPDTDIVVRLTDVYPDGRSMLVVDGIIRARYYNSPDFTGTQALQPGEAYLLTVDLGPTSMVFNAGHRIRVSVTSSNAPRFAPNPNTGAMYLQEGESGRVATTTILRDVEHPSAIVLPVR